MSKPKAPKSPDPYQVANAQAGLNKETAAYNAAIGRTNQQTPFGSISWSQTGTDPSTGAPIWSSQESLSPQLQGLLDNQISNQSGIASAIGNTIGQLPTSPFDPSSINTDNIRDASYQRQVAQLTPQFKEGFTQLQGMLSDRGLPIGSEIATNEMNRYDDARNNALTQASRQAELDAGAEQSRQFSQMMQQYQMPFNQLSQLLGGSQSVGNPQFQNVSMPQSANTDLSSGVWADYQNKMNQYNQNQSNMFQGLLGIGKLGLGLL